MQIFRKPLSDDEYVERARKQIRMSKWVNWTLLPLYILAIAYSAMLLLPHMLSFCTFHEGRDQEFFQSAYFYGTAFGVTLGLLFIVFGAASAFLIRFRYRCRMEKLALSYFDNAKASGRHDESDLAFLERARRLISRRSWTDWLIHASALLILVAIFSYLSHVSTAADAALIGVQIGPALGIISGSFALGSMLGFIFVLNTGMAVPIFLNLLYIQWLQKLLVKYHDLAMSAGQGAEKGSAV